MALEDLKGLLARLKRFTLPHEEIRNVVAEELHKISLDVSFENIQVRDGVLYINTGSNRALKNEIFLYQEKILSRLREKFGKRAPTRLA